jgi:hypothetical protein
MNAAYERAFNRCSDEMVNYILSEEVLRPLHPEIACGVLMVDIAERRRGSRT